VPERRLTITSSAGLHARPAGLLTQAVTASGMDITLGRDGGTPVNARSILALMSLGIQGGEEIVLSSTAADSDAVLDSLVEILATAD
jgi:phosphocarrier protein